jgi:hypothetical protein
MTIDNPDYLIHRHWMSQAIALAQSAGEAGEVPVGAAIVDANNTLIAAAENRRERGGSSPTNLAPQRLYPLRYLGALSDVCGCDRFGTHRSSRVWSGRPKNGYDPYRCQYS